MPSATRLYTVEDVRAMPDDRNRYETIAGQLFVTPAPGTRHQRVLGRLYLVLATYVNRHHMGVVLFAPTDVVLGPMTLVEPDLLFVRTERASLVTEREIVGAPDLAVEVLSPSTRTTDRTRKRVLYQEAGVAEYWVVDHERATVEVFRPGAVEADVCRDALRWRPDPDIEPLTVDLTEVFAP